MTVLSELLSPNFVGYTGSAGSQGPIGYTGSAGLANVSITNDTTSNATRYVTITDATSGGVTGLTVSSTKLYYNPSTGTLSATNFNSLSDITLKENINKEINSLEVLDMLEPASFNWKDNGNKSYGLIAQELELIMPELVETNSDGVKTVSYIPLIAILIDAVKKLKDRQ